MADVHHHREADHLGRAVEITEGIAHRRKLQTGATRLKPIWSDTAVGSAGCWLSMPAALIEPEALAIHLEDVDVVRWPRQPDNPST